MKTKPDSDSGHSPSSEDEKIVGVKPGEFENLDSQGLPPDPDAHLSDEERAKIVLPSSILNAQLPIHGFNADEGRLRTVASSGNSTSV